MPYYSGKFFQNYFYNKTYWKFYLNVKKQKSILFFFIKYLNCIYRLGSINQFGILGNNLFKITSFINYIKLK